MGRDEERRGGKKSKYNNIPHIQQQHNGYKLACKRLLPLFSQPFQQQQQQQQTSLDKEETEDELADATTLPLLLGHPAKGTFVYCTK